MSSCHFLAPADAERERLAPYGPLLQGPERGWYSLSAQHRDDLLQAAVSLSAELATPVIVFDQGYQLYDEGQLVDHCELLGGSQGDEFWGPHAAKIAAVFPSVPRERIHTALAGRVERLSAELEARVQASGLSRQPESVAQLFTRAREQIRSMPPGMVKMLVSKMGLNNHPELAPLVEDPLGLFERLAQDPETLIRLTPQTRSPEEAVAELAEALGIPLHG